MRLRTILGAFLVLVVGSATAQQSLSIEVGEQAPFIASSNYEYRFANTPFGLGASLGISAFATGEITRLGPNGNPESGRYTDWVIPISGYGFASWGARHRLYVLAGATISNQLSFNAYPSGGNNSWDALVVGVLGAGYEWHPGPWFFRAVPYILYLGEEASDFFPL